MESKPEIVVISLERANERRQAIEKQFAALGLPFTFFDAVDGKLGHELFSRYSSEKARAIGEIPLNPGHLGCFASHYIIWQRCIDSAEAKIVVEDDAVLYEGMFQSFLDSIPDLPDYIECLRLFESKSRKRQYTQVFEAKNAAIGKFYRGHKSTTGYYLTPAAAEKLIKYANHWVEPVDIVMDQFWANKVECYGLIEPCLTHNSMFDSDIDAGVDTKKERRGLMRLRWRWYLLKGKVRREIHNLRFRLANR